MSDTVLYGMSTVLARLINYTLVRIHTGVAAPDGYGIISIFYAYMILFNALYTYGMETSFFRFATKASKEEQERVFNNIMTSLMLTSVFFSSLLYFNAEAIGLWMGYDNSALYVQWFAMLLTVDTLLVLPFAKLRIEQKALRFATLKVTEVIITVGLNIFFLILCRDIHEGKYLQEWKSVVDLIYDPSLGIGYAFLANLLAKVLIFITFFKQFITWRPQLDWKRLQQYYRYGFPLILIGVAFFVNEASDKILLEKWLPEGFYEQGDSTYAMGVYAACYKLSIFITLGVTAYKYAAEPFFYAQAGQKDSPRLFARVMKYFVIFLMMMVVGVVANLDWLAGLLIGKEEYLVGLSVVPILLMANVFLGVYYNLSVWFKVTDRTKFGAFLSLGGAMITVLGNYFLIPILGYHGSAIATLACYGSMMIASYWFGQKYYPVPYQVGNALLYVFSGVLVAYVVFNLEIMHFWTSFFVKNSILMAFVLLILFLERQELRKVVNK
ncbi:polysaccharide biosynthesis C-terminal domain-containing protein [Algivirga pacifica]|uniref:Polysaccharide biosynthesis C-terminal domain-containing protein n=2 Tax=Algivirga pacifica TaxID=1162670 RepID=A0ABP9DAF4_9BACT